MALNLRDADWLAYGLHGHLLIDHLNDPEEAFRSIDLLRDAATRLEVSLLSLFETRRTARRPGHRHAHRQSAGGPVRGH